MKFIIFYLILWELNAYASFFEQTWITFTQGCTRFLNFVNVFFLWAGTSRPIIWNKNLRSLCVSAGWMYILTLGKPRPIRTSSRLNVVYGICQELPNVVYGICQGLPSDILSIHIIIYFNGQYWLYTWYYILYVKISTFVVPLHMSHAIYTAVSVRSINRYNVISFFETLRDINIV